jgi:hypothetical protein
MIERRFAVVRCADVIGYSRLMRMDEEGTLASGSNVIYSRLCWRPFTGLGQWPTFMILAGIAKRQQIF